VIAYPVRYNFNDECVEDAEFKVLAHPFATIEEGVEIKHERGVMIALAVNAYVPGTFLEPVEQKATAASTAVLATAVFHVPSEVLKLLSPVQRGKLIRIERKHKKLVAKLIVRAAQAAKLQ